MPTELIVANVLHRIAGRAVKLAPMFQTAGVKECQILDAVTRDILCNIANEARLDVVLKAIAAAGGPADAGVIAARFKAVKEMHAPERK